jgi:hypothetical protein
MRIGCDCTFLYWSREILSTFLADIYAAPEQAMRLPYVIAAFGDAAGLLGGAQHEADNTMFQKAYEQVGAFSSSSEMMRLLRNSILTAYSQHVHSILTPFLCSRHTRLAPHLYCL